MDGDYGTDDQESVEYKDCMEPRLIIGHAQMDKFQGDVAGMALNFNEIDQEEMSASTKNQMIDNIEVVRDLGYSRTKVVTCSALVFLLDIVINLDHGAIPAAITAI